MNGNQRFRRISKWKRNIRHLSEKERKIFEKQKEANCGHKVTLWLNLPLSNGFIMRTKMCGKCKKKLEAWIFSQKTLERDLNRIVRHRQKPEKPKRPNRGF